MVGRQNSNASEHIGKEEGTAEQVFETVLFNEHEGFQRTGMHSNTESRTAEQ